MPAYGSPMILVRPTFSRTNPAFTERLGYATLELSSLSANVHPADRATFEAFLERKQGRTEARLLSRDGAPVSFRWQFRDEEDGVAILGIGDSPGAAPHRLGLPVDLQGNTLAETLEAMVHIVESKNPGLRCSILLVDDDKKYITVGAGPSLPKEYN